MRKRKGIGAAAAALALMTLLTGCAQGGDLPAAQDAREEAGSKLRFLHIWGEHEETMQAIVDSIEAQNEGMQVDVTTVTWDKVGQEIATALESERMYDVFFQYASDVGSAQAKGMLLELDPYMDDAWRGSFIDGALEEYSVEGKVYGVPYRGSGVVVIYNAEMFSEHGWKEPRTIDELARLMEACASAGIQPISAAGRPDGFQLNSLRAILTDYLAQDAGTLEDELRLNGRKVDWQGEMAYGASIIKNWAQRGYFGTNPLSVDGERALDRFLSGRAAMLVCNTNELHLLRGQKEYIPFEMHSFLFPAMNAADERLFSNGCFEDGFAVWAGTEQPEQAAAFLKGLTSKRSGSLWAEETLSVMALQNVATEDALLEEFGEYFKIAGKYAVQCDYDKGDSDTLKAQLFVDYMSSSMTADEYESNYERITKDAIRAAK